MKFTVKSNDPRFQESAWTFNTLAKAQEFALDMKWINNKDFLVFDENELVWTTSQIKASYIGDNKQK